jgi:hypothetical protein
VTLAVPMIPSSEAGSRVAEFEWEPVAPK